MMEEQRAGWSGDGTHQGTRNTLNLDPGGMSVKFHQSGYLICVRFMYIAINRFSKQTQNTTKHAAAVTVWAERLLRVSRPESSSYLPNLQAPQELQADIVKRPFVCFQNYSIGW